MRVLIIRHAQSTNNVLLELGRDAERVQDPEITDLGLEQARHLGRLLGSLPSPGVEVPEQIAWRPAVLYTSLMLRAAHTTTVLAEHTGAEQEAWVDLHETGGIFLDDPTTGERRGLPGATRETLTRRFPHLRLPETVRDEGWWNRPFEADPDAVVQRAQRVVDRLLDLSTRAENGARTLGVVTHAGFYGFLLPRLLRLAGNTWLHAVINNTGCTLLSIEPADTRLIFHNNLRHLPLGSIT